MRKICIKILLSVLLISNIAEFCYATKMVADPEDELRHAGIDLFPSSVINTLLNHQDFGLRMVAADFIAKRKMKEAIPALIQVIEKENDFRLMLKLYSARALAIMGEKKGFTELRRICDLPVIIIGRDKQGVNDIEFSGISRCRAAAYLAEFGDSYGYRKVIEALNDRTPKWVMYRYRAVYPLIEFDKFKNINILPDLLWALKDDDARVRDASATILKATNKIEVIPHLEKAYELEKDERVKSTIEWSLKSLKEFKLNKEKEKSKKK